MCHDIREALEAEREKLLDISARNRLIHTQRSNARSGLLEIINESSEEVFQILVRDGRSMKFRHSTILPGDGDPQEVENNEIGVAAENNEIFLKTRLGSEQLEKRLLKLYRDARTSEEEQGVNILFLAMGFLEWHENERSTEKRQGPLLLIPVVLKRETVRNHFVLRYAEEEILTNISLQQKLRECVALPDVPEITDLSPRNYFRDVEAAIAEQPRWKVLRDDIVLWHFSFSKHLMYRDLGPDAWPIDLKIEKTPADKRITSRRFPQRASAVCPR